MKTLPLTCTCGRPWAHIAGGRLIVISRHGGKEHTNSIALSTLLKLLNISESEFQVIIEQTDVSMYQTQAS